MGSDRAGPKKRVPALDGYRGIAILLVLIIHTYGAGIAFSDSAVWKVPRAGWIGVDLFFVLSGYLITGILLDTRYGRGYYRVFYARRSLRIFPAYYFVLAALLLSGALIAGLRTTEGYGRLVDHQFWLWTYTTNIKMALANSPLDFGVFLPDTFLFDTSHFWSLAVEEQFYLCWPLLVAVLGLRRLVWAIAGIVVVCPLLRYGLVTADHGYAAYVLTPCRMDTLAFGGLVAAMERLGRLDALTRVAWPAIAGTGIAILSIAVMRGGYDNTDRVVAVAGYSLNAMFFAMVLARVLVAPEAGVLHRALTVAPLRFLGKYSYAIYLVHIPLVRPLTQSMGYDEAFRARVTASLFVWMTVLFVWTLAGSSVIALLMWYALEKRMLSLKRYFPYGSARD